MDKNFYLINGIILFYIIQRVSEMVISKSNEKWLKSHHAAVEVDPREGLLMRLFHTSWFIALLIESNIVHQIQKPAISLIICLILGLCLAVRFHTMKKLRQFWTIKIFSMKNQQVATSGLFKYIRHPNYLIVIIEFILIPFLFKAYLTMVLFSLMNLLVLKQRIKLEESTLMNQTNYLELFFEKKRFFPFLFLVCFSFHSMAAEMSYHFGNYDEARKSKSFIKFESTSTKLGFITTSFDGYAKDIKITYTQSDDQISALMVMIPVKSLDTDINSRNDKMSSEVLEAEKYPNLLVTISENIPLTPGEHTANMIFTIKDKKLTKAVQYNVLVVDGKKSISGSTNLGLKEMGLPDPSIAIAKVRDRFDLTFAVNL